MAKLITEISKQVVTESIDKSLYVVGIFSSAEIKNNNGRVYAKSLLEREINKIQDQVNEKALFGQLSHPDNPEINLEKAAIMIEGLEWDGDNVVGKAKVLENTPCGDLLKGIIGNGGKVGISSRGLGTVSESGAVNDDYALITWDMVVNASNPGSKYVNGIYEGEEFSIIKPQVMERKEAEKIYTKHIWQVIKKIIK